MRRTTILLPMPKSDSRQAAYAKKFKTYWQNNQDNNYVDIDAFFAANAIHSDEYYNDILRASITRPKVFIKRAPSEKWVNPFNPCILSLLGANMDIQFIIEEYSCAAYVVEYVNKTNRGVSNLQRRLIQTMNEHPEFDIIEITRKLSIDLLNSVELTSQEAAWYLLRLPMSESSVIVHYLATCWPVERQKLRKTKMQLDEEDVTGDSTDIWKEDWFKKYENRPSEFELLTLAQVVAYYTIPTKLKIWKKRINPRIIRYRNYDMVSQFDEYRREMVTLHIPFRNEESELLAEARYLQIYHENESLILERRREFEKDININKTIEICRKMCVDAGDGDEIVIGDLTDLMIRHGRDADPFADFYRNPTADMNSDLLLATLNRLGPIAKKRENLMEKADFNHLMRKANDCQKGLLLHVIGVLLEKHNNEPIQIFFTGPAGCGKTFVIHLLKEIYNRFSNTDGYCNAYICCASTGKAAVAIEGTTVHTALKISISRNLPLSYEVAQQYRTLFKYVRAMIVDEVSMIGAELLQQVDTRLKQITGVKTNFGEKDVILVGDLRQLPPVRATPIYRQIKQSLAGPTLWRGLKFYELTEVMRQSNREFSEVLTCIGNGDRLEEAGQLLIQSRFVTEEFAQQECPNAIRLFVRNTSVNEYNARVLNAALTKIISTAVDVFAGCSSSIQTVHARQLLHKMSVIDTGGLPYELPLVIGKPYIITTNIDVADGLANGALGYVEYVEFDNDQNIKRVWMKFPNDTRTGQLTRKRATKFASRNEIPAALVPISKRTASITLSPNKTIVAKRRHFPLVPACAVTIHKSQGGTFDKIVYEYENTHERALVYVALSRVTSIDGLYIVSKNGDGIFHHGLKSAPSLLSLRNELSRLATNTLITAQDKIIEFMNLKEVSLLTFNCQNLTMHREDLGDLVTQSCPLLLLTETWLCNEEQVAIPNFSCIVKFKRLNMWGRAGGVAMYQKCNTSLVITPDLEILWRQTGGLEDTVPSVGEICSAQCSTSNGINFLSVVVYISPHQAVIDIIKFINFVLLPYAESSSSNPFNDAYHMKPMVLSGDFNIDFSSPEAEELMDFLNQKFGLNLNTERTTATTQHGTTIDAVFQRKLETLESKTYVSYFSYHKPIISCLSIALVESPKSPMNI